MFAVMFQARFSDRSAPLAGEDGHPVDRGQAPAIFETVEGAGALASLCVEKGWERPTVVDVGGWGSVATLCSKKGWRVPAYVGC